MLIYIWTYWQKTCSYFISFYLFQLTVTYSPMLLWHVYWSISSLRSHCHIWEVLKHRHIQFKIEHSDNTGSLSLLDFKIQISLTGKIYISFYRKPTTKNLFEHFKSAISLSAKINYIRNEFTIDAAKKKTKSHTPHT